MGLIYDFCLPTCSISSISSTAETTRSDTAWYPTSGSHTTACSTVRSCWPGQIATSVILVLKTLISNTKTLSFGYSHWAEVAITERVWEKCATGFSFTNLIMTSKWFNSNQGRAPAHCLSRGYDDLCLLWWCDTKKNPYHVCPLDVTKSKLCGHGVCLKASDLLSLVLGDTQLFHCCAPDLNWLNKVVSKPNW